MKKQYKISSYWWKRPKILLIEIIINSSDCATHKKMKTENEKKLDMQHINGDN